jgi:hypothetical protein
MTGLTQQQIESNYRASPKEALYIGDTMSGNAFALDLSTLNDACDCKAVYISHEGELEPLREWESIADFLEEAART